MLNAVVLWNTRYMDLALTQLRAGGVESQEADVARLSPLGFRHVNFLHDVAVDSVVGQGKRGYLLALDAIAARFGSEASGG